MNKKLKNLFAEYIDYCNYTKGLRPQTVLSYKEAFKHFSNLMPDVETPRSINIENMNYFFKKLQTRKRIVGKGEERIGVKASTVFTYWSRLNSFFSWLENNNYIEKNPLPKMRPAQPQYNDKKSLSKAELQKILVAIDLHSTNPFLLKRDKVIVYLLFYCGLRKGELASLRVSDIDFIRGAITIRGATSKSKKDRLLPLNPVLEMHLKDYISERNKKNYKTEYLLASNNCDKQLTFHGLKHWVKKFVELSGVKFHLHQFRHTFACGLAADGIGSYKLQKLMGHTDLRMTDRYLRSMGVEDFRDEVNRLCIDNLV
ncbi:site-specific integrase [Patescibacteria group bacterium]|nr:site-specific integrase [Patescibacteria group bacterium]